MYGPVKVKLYSLYPIENLTFLDFSSSYLIFCVQILLFFIIYFIIKYFNHNIFILLFIFFK
jgi:hypothetical protein